ncbi:hypothetical protein HKX48_008325 [Thoreauomyces humboldtii]|nr:hypothetical protein HKX48_008325 [Thoreauomyces humboldtii]
MHMPSHLNLTDASYISLNKPSPSTSKTSSTASSTTGSTTSKKAAPKPEQQQQHHHMDAMQSTHALFSARPRI